MCSRNALQIQETVYVLIELYCSSQLRRLSRPMQSQRKTLIELRRYNYVLIKLIQILGVIHVSQQGWTNRWNNSGGFRGTTWSNAFLFKTVVQSLNHVWINKIVLHPTTCLVEAGAGPNLLYVAYFWPQWIRQIQQMAIVEALRSMKQ